MPASRFFVICGVSFLAGILLASFGFGGWWAGVGAGTCLVLALAELAHGRATRRTQVLAVAGCGLLFFAGVARFGMAQKPSQFTPLLNQKGEWQGTVVSDADVRLSSRQITMRLDGFSQNILVVTDPDRDVGYGDRLLLAGSLTEAEQFPGSDFDYGEYLKLHNVYALMRRPRVIILARGQGNPIKEALFLSKWVLVNRIKRHVPEPQASLLVGILIGAQKTVPEEVVEQFNRTGLTHIVAVSGYNISIIIVSLGFLPRYAGRKAGFVVSLAVIAGFVVLTGASPSIVRAGVMGSLLLVAGFVGRPYAVTPSLVASAAFMCAFNPRILFWDKGFQLSFAATAGIVYVLPYLETLFEKAPDWLELKSILLATFAATWFTWPLLVEGFGRVSLVAPLANILVLPFIPWLMLFGFLSLLPWVGAGFAYISNLVLLYILKSLGYLSSWSWASMDTDSSAAMFLAAGGFSLGSFLFLRALARKRGIKAKEGQQSGLGLLS